MQGGFSEERLLQLEKDWIVNMETVGPLGVNTRDQLISRTRILWICHVEVIDIVSVVTKLKVE